uniref:Uncharacterized protein n=1 Tax=Chenopodium quinoa TaxID=63459 RepID=A0A803KXD7_CHEQI
MFGRGQPSHSGGSGRSITSRREANPKIRCSCGKDAVVRTDTQCETFKWRTTTSHMEDLEMKIMEKDTEICELEFEQKMKVDRIKKVGAEEG